MIQYLRLGLYVLHHSPDGLYRKHRDLAEGIDFQSPHKGDLFEFVPIMHIVASLSVAAPAYYSEMRAMAESITQ